jgi:flagellum-specific peptidoglycan hydrolase FlgJ
MLSPAQLRFLQLAAHASVVAENATGCPAALSCAQCVTESAWGASIIPGNNCFGIKATDSSETYQITREYINGTWETLKLAFESYPTLADCFTAHGRLIQGGPYSSVWRQYEQDRDLDGLIRGISKIYATDPNYAVTILSLAHNSQVTGAISKARIVA